MIHSLYTNKEIFLRELISNASDALDRLRFEALSNPELIDTGRKSRNRRSKAIPKRKTITIHDNGIGMSREEVIANIGTIAKSGTRELLQTLKEKQSSDVLNISDRAIRRRLLFRLHGGGSRDAVDAARGRRQSDTMGVGRRRNIHHHGGRKFTRGTSITLHLKKFEEDDEVEDFTDKWVISRIVKRYSDFVAYPVFYKDKDGKEADKPLNSMKPIWTRPRSEVTRRGIQGILQTHLPRLERADDDLVVPRRRPVRIPGVALYSVPGAV